MKIRGRLHPRLGLAFVSERREHRGGIEQRTHPRFACSERFPVSAAARCALFFREWLYFRVTEVSAGGMALKASLANKALLPGLCLEFTIRLPLQPGHIVKGRITSVRRDQGAAEFTVGVAFEQPPRQFLRSIGEYLLFIDKRETPRSLREGGLDVGSVERVVTFGYATSPEERAATRDLRIRAHRASGQLSKLRADDLVCVCDAHSRHLVCRFGGRIVGYVRLNFVERDARRSRYVGEGGHEIPEHILAAGLVEGGAAVVDPDFRRTGLQLALAQRAAMVARAAGFGYLLAAVADSGIEVYRQWGFEVIESRSVEPKPGWRFVSHLLCLNVNAVIAGSGASDPPPDWEDAGQRFVDLETPRLQDG